MLRSLLVLIIATLLLAGCAMEARHADMDYGRAQHEAWEMQLAETGHRNAGLTPESMAGIHAEKVM